jgi:hypothetical protein
MRKSEVERLLRDAGALAKERHFILFGSQAIWGLVKRVPRELTVSIEADLYPRTYPQTIFLIEAALGRRSKFYAPMGFSLIA